MLRLQKGQEIDVDQNELYLVSVGSDLKKFVGDYLDFWSFIFCLDKDGKTLDESCVVYYANRSFNGDSIEYIRQDLIEGEDDQDIDQFIVDLSKLPPNVETLAISLCALEDVGANINYIPDPYVRILKIKDGQDTNGVEIARYSFGEDLKDKVTVIPCEIGRKDGGWSFNAVSLGYDFNIEDLCRKLGLNA